MVVLILLLREYISMSVNIPNTFEGRLNLVSTSVCRSVLGGPLEVFFPGERNGFPYVGLYIVLSVTL